MAVKMPVDLRALYAAGKRLNADRERPVRLAVLVEVDAPDALVEAAREAFAPTSSSGIVDVAVIEPEQMLRVDSRADAVVVLAGSGEHLGATLEDLQRRAMPTAVLAVREDASSFALTIAHPLSDVFAGQDPARLFPGALAGWLLARLEKAHTSLGHNFPFMRRAVAMEAVKSCAAQNAVVGAVVFIPGADMPIMTLNQGRMLLNIAAAYGQPLDKGRVKELGAVVAGGFLFRTFAREIVGLVPVLGWAVKAGIAYSGTMAMGIAAIGYFEQGADIAKVARVLAERAGETVAEVTHRVAPRAVHEPALAVAAEPHARADAATAHVGSGASAVGAEGAPDSSAISSDATDPGDGPVQPLLIDVPPVKPTFGVIETANRLGERPGPTL